MEFSKKLLIFSWAVTLSLTALTIYISLKSLPLDAMIVITPLAWTESTAQTGFYHWKAKNENRAKHAQRFIREIGMEWGVDAAIRISEIVLKD